MAQSTKITVSRTYKTLAVITIVTSLIWTAMGLYSAVSKPGKSDVAPEILAPVDPSFDMETLKKVQEKRQLTEEVKSDEVVQQAMQILNANKSPSPKNTPAKATINEVTPATPTVSPTPAESASSSATPAP